MKKILVVIFLLVLLIGGFFLIKNVSVADSDGVITIEVIDKEENVLKVKEIEFRKGDTLVKLLEKNFDNVVFNSTSYGNLLLCIESIETDFTTSYISIYVNDESSMVGIDGIELIDGIKISLIEVILSWKEQKNW